MKVVARQICGGGGYMHYDIGYVGDVMCDMANCGSEVPKVDAQANLAGRRMPLLVCYFRAHRATEVSGVNRRDCCGRTGAMSGLPGVRRVFLAAINL